MHYLLTLVRNSFICSYLIAVLFSLNIQAQETDVVNQLAEAYNEFDYDRCAELLNLAFNSLDQLPLNDRAEIYKYAAFIAIHNGNNTLAGNHFWNLLSINPNYSLDPVTTAPKLLTLFQKTKIEFLEDLNQRLKNVQGADNEREIPWRSFIFPGWEQWYRGYTTRGTILVTSGIASLGGLVYSAIMAKQKRKDYLAAIDAGKITSQYHEYNTYYQNQYYFAYAFVTIWIISQVDLTLWSHTNLSFSISNSPSIWHEYYPTASLHIKLFP